MTSSSSRQPGKTSTKRNSCVLNDPRAMAQSRRRSLAHDPRNSDVFSSPPASAIRRASAWTSRSEGALIPQRGYRRSHLLPADIRYE